jgi:hypothetical protein
VTSDPLTLEVEHQREVEVGQHGLVVAVEVRIDVVAPEEAEAVADRETCAAGVQHTDHPHPTTQQAFAAVSGV